MSSHTKENKNNASVTLRELELPKGATITINGVHLSWSTLYKISCLGNIGDLDSMMSSIARGCMDIASADNEHNPEILIVDNSFFCYVKLFYDLMNSLKETLIEVKEGGNHE